MRMISKKARLKKTRTKELWLTSRTVLKSNRILGEIEILICSLIREVQLQVSFTFIKTEN